jgi:hypothetical protein
VPQYKVVYRRDAKGRWVASARGLRRCRGRGRSIREARLSLRESLDRAGEADVYRAEFLEDVRLARAARRLLVRHWRARRKAEKERHNAEAATREALAALLSEKVKPRDAAELLGVSPQRVQQLLRAR